jgi:hypothetical protein
VSDVERRRGGAVADGAGRMMVMPSRRYAVLAISYALAFCIVAAYSGAVLATKFSELHLLIGAVTTLVALVWMAAAVYMVRFFIPRPLMVLDDRGLLDRSSTIGVGFVAWDELKRVRYAAIGRSGPVLTVDARHPDRVIARQRFGLKRAALRYNLRHDLGIVSVTQRILAIPAEDLEHAIEYGIRHHRLEVE